jgi:hypothetical protein
MPNFQISEIKAYLGSEVSYCNNTVIICKI